MKKIIIFLFFLAAAMTASAQSFHINKRTATVTDSLLCEAKSTSSENGGGSSDSSDGKDNGHEYVDLGLSVKWATCNVGASTPEVYGGHYAWGETSTKSTYSWSTYKYGSSSNKLTKYCTNKNFGNNSFTDGKKVLESEDDAATANWGGQWRMPTYSEMQELIDNCTWTWTTLNGVSGYQIAGSNGNSIFLPATGYYNNSRVSSVGICGDYWLSELPSRYSSGPSAADRLYFTSNSVSNNFADRYYGYSVRPVHP